MDKQFPIPFEKWMTTFATLAIVIGTALIAFLGWKIAGGVIIAYGLLSLFLAYHMGSAPRVEEVGSQLYLVTMREPGEDFAGGEDEVQPEWLPESSLRNMVN